MFSHVPSENAVQYPVIQRIELNDLGIAFLAVHAAPTGLEPAAFAVTGRCSDQIELRDLASRRIGFDTYPPGSGAGTRTPIAWLTAMRPAVERHQNDAALLRLTEDGLHFKSTQDS